MTGDARREPLQALIAQWRRLERKPENFDVRDVYAACAQELADTLAALVEKLDERAAKAHRDAKLMPARSKARSILNAIGDTHSADAQELADTLAALASPLVSGGWQPLTRVDVIDEGGRLLSKWDVAVEPSWQDDGRTLKLFLKRRTAQEQP